MKPHFLFPVSPLNSRMIDEAFQDQAIALKQAGFGTSVIDIEGGRIFPKPEPDAVCVYRGWMLNPEEYMYFAEMGRLAHLNLLTTRDQYLAAHHLPNWYPLIKNYTPNTQVFPFDKPLFINRTLKEAAVPITEFIKSMQGVHHLSGHGDG